MKNPSDQDREILRRRLWNLLENLGAGVSGPTIDHIEAVYDTRPYHNMVHIQSCILQVDKFAPTATPSDLKSVELALWFHDLSYDPKKHDNEERSAQFLRDISKGIDTSIVDAACQAIMATRHKAVPENPIDKMVVDIDLSILSASVADFDTYEKNVRKEYNFVDEVTWVAGRTGVLQSFLDREWIYSTPLYRRLYEGDARANLKRSIAKLVA